MGGCSRRHVLGKGKGAAPVRYISYCPPFPRHALERWFLVPSFYQIWASHVTWRAIYARPHTLARPARVPRRRALLQRRR